MLVPCKEQYVGESSKDGDGLWNEIGLEQESKERGTEIHQFLSSIGGVCKDAAG